MGEFQHIEHKKKRLFLQHYSDCGEVKASAQAAGIGRTTHYGWLDNDPEYKAAFEVAEDNFRNVLEAVARRKAIEEAHPTMLIFLLKGEYPEKYAERQKVEQSGSMELEHSHTDNLKDLTDEELETLDRILDRAAAGNGQHTHA